MVMRMRKIGRSGIDGTSPRLLFMSNGDDQEKFSLSVFEEAELKWLRRKVDELVAEEFRAGARSNIKQDLWYAREDLEQFVSKLRKKGRRI